MLKLDLRTVLRIRGIVQPYRFLREQGFTHNIAQKLISGKARHCTYAHIERLCRVLLCTPNDLMTWKPDKNEPYPDNLPLRALMKKPQIFNVAEETRKLPLEEMIHFQEKAADWLKEEKTPHR